VRRTVFAMKTFTDGYSVAHQDSADAWIRRRAALPARGELAGSRQIDPIGRVDYGVTLTPFQNAMRSLICFAASFGSG
jgi:hypothetical protein